MEKTAALLFEKRDEEYAAFQRRLIPNIPESAVIGVRTPQLRDMAKAMLRSGEAEDFLAELPHRYFEENQLHGFIISGIRDFDRCIEELEKFLPHVDNWATCDQTSPGVFKKQADRLLGHIPVWLASSHVYTARFGIGMLMEHFLDERFDPAYPKWVAAVKSGEYYVNMEIAWYFATALAKQWDAVIPFIQTPCMDRWTHNKAIQKAVESRRITPEQKTLLKSLKI